jgi:hypothetical protein
MADYFYSTDGKARLGPVSSRQLKQLADEGVLARNALIWKEGLPDWIPADRLKGLFTTPAAEPPPPAHRQPAADTSAAAGYALEAPPAADSARSAGEQRTWWYMRDGVQTGPIMRSALIDLVSSGIVPSDAFVWTEGMSQWRPARRVPELQPAAASSPGGRAASPGSPPTVQTAMPASRPTSAAASDPAIRWLIPVGRSPWAIVSGYCGLLGLVPICGMLLSPAAIVTGIVAIVHLKKRPDLVGMPRAITGIVLGVIGAAFAAIMIAAMAMDGP